jgi:hypothetical protein
MRVPEETGLHHPHSSWPVEAEPRPMQRFTGAGNACELLMFRASGGSAEPALHGKTTPGTDLPLARRFRVRRGRTPIQTAMDPAVRLLGITIAGG